MTTFGDPHPQLAGVTSQFVTYTRNDGVQLNGTIYLPPGYKAGTRLPMFMWAYPAEFTSADEAGQISGNENHFLQVGGASQLLLLAQGYAVFDNPTMPIVGPGETANDHYIEQLVASAEAAIDKAVEMGVADRDRIGVGGHSYGAFMTGNLLAHSRLFRAGIARSGAYNRTLTPFGFQNERRNFWEVPDIVRQDVAVLLRESGQGSDPADPRRDGRQLRHVPDPVRALLHGAQGLRRDRAVRHAAVRGARLRRRRVEQARDGRDDQLARQVREEREAAIDRAAP